VIAAIAVVSVAYVSQCARTAVRRTSAPTFPQNGVDVIAVITLPTRTTSERCKWKRTVRARQSSSKNSRRQQQIWTRMRNIGTSRRLTSLNVRVGTSLGHWIPSIRKVLWIKGRQPCLVYSCRVLRSCGSARFAKQFVVWVVLENGPTQTDKIIRHVHAVH